MAIVEVAIEAEGWSVLPEAEAQAERAVNAALAACGVATLPGAEVSVLLTDDSAVAALNRQWRDKDQPTNVLSFPAVAPDRLAKSPLIGDIALALETCQREAVAEDKTLSAHVTHLVVHGTLHLVGFDHQTPMEAEAMEALEGQVLAGLGLADPYADMDIEEKQA